MRHLKLGQYRCLLPTQPVETAKETLRRVQAQALSGRRPSAFVGPSGQGGLLLVACGALARELVDIQRQFPDRVVEITCLPASWHNHPEKIVPGVRRKVDAALRNRRNVAVVYGDCGTGGELDAYLEQVGVPRIPGPH